MDIAQAVSLRLISANTHGGELRRTVRNPVSGPDISTAWLECCRAMARQDRSVWEIQPTRRPPTLLCPVRANHTACNSRALPSHELCETPMACIRELGALLQSTFPHHPDRPFRDASVTRASPHLDMQSRQTPLTVPLGNDLVGSSGTPARAWDNPGRCRRSPK